MPRIGAVFSRRRRAASLQSVQSADCISGTNAVPLGRRSSTIRQPPGHLARDIPDCACILTVHCFLLRVTPSTHSTSQVKTGLSPRSSSIIARRRSSLVRKSAAHRIPERDKYVCLLRRASRTFEALHLTLFGSRIDHRLGINRGPPSFGQGAESSGGSVCAQSRQPLSIRHAQARGGQPLLRSHSQFRRAKCASIANPRRCRGNP